MGGAPSAGGGRAARAVRLLLLLVLLLAAVEFLFGSILDASPLKTYLYTPLYNATQPTFKNAEKQMHLIWPKTQSTAPSIHNSTARDIQLKNMTVINNNITNTVNTSITKNLTDIDTNITVQDAAFRAHQNTTPVLVSKLVDIVRNAVTTEGAVQKTDPALPLCDALPPDLGPVPVNKTELELDFVEKKYPEIQWGGRYTPPNCTARYRVAIIVPYRDRQQHLAIFLNHMHPFLMKQQIEYGIFIIEQEGNKDFNRAKLMNVGFVESQKMVPGGWQCFIFHDIDLLPLDTRNMYSCPRQPRHMSASIDKLQFQLPYEDIFGGVSAMTTKQFTKVNGFSNKYWGWGGEDDDMFYRLKKVHYHIARYKMSIARYAMLDHKKSSPNPKRYQLLAQTSKIFQKDGLSTLEYDVISVVRNHLYTYILANIDERS